MVVEVFDEGKVNDVLKRDEIRRPEDTQGVSGVRRDNVGVRRNKLGITRGNLNKDSSEQSLTEVIVDDNEGDLGIEEGILSDDDSTHRDKTLGIERDKYFIDNKNHKGRSNNVIRKTKLPVNVNIPDFDENDLKSLRNLIVSEKSNRHNNTVKNTSYEHSDVTKDIQNNGTANNDDNKNNNNNSDNRKNMKIHYLDAIAEKYGIANVNNEFVTNADKNSKIINSTNNTDNVDIDYNHYNNSNNDINNNNNSNDNNNSETASKNNKNNSNNNNNNEVDHGNEIQDLLNSIGSLKSKGKEISDEQLTKLKETVQDFLNLKTVTNVKQTKSNGRVVLCLCCVVLQCPF